MFDPFFVVALLLHSNPVIAMEARMTGRTIDELVIGDRAELTCSINADLVASFVTISGDHNPLHHDAEFAASTSFGVPIAPGILTAAFISAVIGTELPGPGAVYLSQSLKFLRPVMVNDTITTRVEVTEVIPGRNRVCLRTECVNGRGEPVLTGEAWVMPAKAAQSRERRIEPAVALARAA